METHLPGGGRRDRRTDIEETRGDLHHPLAVAHSDEVRSEGGSTPGARAGVRPGLLVLAVAILGVLPYLPALGGEWIFDDRLLIQDNLPIHSLRHLGGWFTRDMWNLIELAGQKAERLSYWRPLVMVSYALDWAISDGNSAWFHITNLLLHALATALSFLALRRWGLTRAPAFLGTLLFAWHPTKGESVAWIAGRTDIFVTVGLLMACAGLSRRLRGSVASGWLLEGFGVVVAFLSKEQALAIPFLVGVEIWAYLGRPALRPALLSPRTSEGRLMLRELLGHAALVIAYLIGRSVMLPLRSFEISGLSPSKHVGFVFESLGRYLILTVWPGDLSTSRALLESNSEGVLVQLPIAVLGALGAMVLLGLAWTFRHRAPGVGVGILLYVFDLVPVVNIVWAGFNTLVSPRFLYLPVLGFALCLGEALQRQRTPQGRRQQLAIALGIGVVLAFGARGAVRSTQFASEDAFWQYELEQKPWAPTALLYRIRRLREEGNSGAALAACQTGHDLAIQHAPHAADGASFVLQALDILSLSSRDVEVEKLESLAEFIRVVLDHSGSARLAVGPWELLVPAGGKIVRALGSQAPSLLLMAAEVEMRLGRDGPALAHGESAVAACPQCPLVLGKASRIALAAGRFDVAMQWVARLENVAPGLAAQHDRHVAEQIRILHEQASQRDGPLGIMARAQELALLHLWGRAFRLLEPHEDAISHESEDGARALGELAFRAGDAAAARRILGARFEPKEVETQVAMWSASQKAPPSM